MAVIYESVRIRMEGGVFLVSVLVRDCNSETEKSHSRPRLAVRIRTRNFRDAKQMLYGRLILLRSVRDVKEYIFFYFIIYYT
jgi:hypothetical protein